MEITASEAARRFSDILDAVEHRGESSVPIEEDDLDVARAHAQLLAHGRLSGRPVGHTIC